MPRGYIQKKHKLPISKLTNVVKSLTLYFQNSIDSNKLPNIQYLKDKYTPHLNSYFFQQSIPGFIDQAFLTNKTNLIALLFSIALPYTKYCILHSSHRQLLPDNLTNQYQSFSSEINSKVFNLACQVQSVEIITKAIKESTRAQLKTYVVNNQKNLAVTALSSQNQNILDTLWEYCNYNMKKHIVSRILNSSNLAPLIWLGAKLPQYIPYLKPILYFDNNFVINHNNVQFLNCSLIIAPQIAALLQVCQNPLQDLFKNTKDIMSNILYNYLPTQYKSIGITVVQEVYEVLTSNHLTDKASFVQKLTDQLVNKADAKETVQTSYAI